MSSSSNEKPRSSLKKSSSSKEIKKESEKNIQRSDSNSRDKKTESLKSKASKKNIYDDDDDEPKSDIKSSKEEKPMKQKKSNHDIKTPDSNHDSSDDSDNGNDDEYDDPGYDFQNTDAESDNSDYEYDDQGSDNDNDDDYDIHDIQHRGGSQRPRPQRKKPQHTNSNQLPNSKSHSYKPSRSASQTTPCDSDIPTDPKTQSGRKKIAKKTLKIITYGPNMGKYTVRRRDGSIEEVNIRKQISNAYKFSETFNPDFYSDSQKTPKKTIKMHSKMCKFEVLPVSTFEAAKKLVKKDHLKTCVLNYASATKPGGGFLNGRQAQEESLSRQSALYVTIKDSQMYKANQNITDDFYNDFMIYSSRIPVFRSSYRERLLSGREVFETSVITSAAPNLHNINQKGDIARAWTLWWNSYKKKLKNRCRKILLLAIEKGNEAIVLGAYGCGVFENSPDKISEIYKKLLVDEELGKYFVKVVFAIIDKNSQNYKAFYNIFSKVKS